MSSFDNNDDCIFSCNIDDLPSNYTKLAIQSYEKYGVFFLRGVFSKSEIKSLREDADQLFIEEVGERNRTVSQIQSETLKHSFSEAFMNTRLLTALNDIFSDPDVSLLPPFNLTKNHMPHSVDTKAMGWHRDCGGELPIKQCREILENPKYMFGKVGVFLQDNAEYGGAIDIVPGSNKDFSRFPRGCSNAVFWLKVLIFVQRYFPFIYKNNAVRKVFCVLIGMITTNVRAGDAVIFDSRNLHKGTPVRCDIEQSMIYNCETLQAELPDNQTKYVLYSQFGNSLGIQSFFYDRLNRKGGESEMDEWIKDAKAVKNSLTEERYFFRKVGSLLNNSFKY